MEFLSKVSFYNLDGNDFVNDLFKSDNLSSIVHKLWNLFNETLLDSFIQLSERESCTKLIKILVNITKQTTPNFETCIKSKIDRIFYISKNGNLTEILSCAKLLYCLNKKYNLENSVEFCSLVGLVISLFERSNIVARLDFYNELNELYSYLNFLLILARTRIDKDESIKSAFSNFESVDPFSPFALRQMYRNIRVFKITFSN